MALIAEIRLFALPVAPAGWLPCGGQRLPIGDYQPLFSIVGWRFGGVDPEHFSLPGASTDGPQVCIAGDGIYPIRGPGRLDTPYVGEVRLFAGKFVPAGWAACDGRPLAIADYPALYAVIGAAYGGADGVFHVPDLRTALIANGEVTVIIATSGITPAAAVPSAALSIGEVS